MAYLMRIIVYSIRNNLSFTYVYIVNATVIRYEGNTTRNICVENSTAPANICFILKFFC